MNPLEREFHNEMIGIYSSLKKELKYNANRFIQLVTQKGGLHAAKQLINKAEGTYGFSVLIEFGRLDLSVEALVLKPKYKDFFTDYEIEICKERLKQYGYKVNLII